MSGIITGIADHGTIVSVLVEGECGVRSVYMDHRPFRDMVEGEGGSIADDIIGREAEVHGEAFEESIEFLD